MVDVFRATKYDIIFVQREAFMTGLTFFERRFAKTKMIFALSLAMFFSPCLEVVAVFFSAGKFGLSAVATLIAVYSIISVSGMLLWVNLVQHGLKKINWHSIEHNAGLLTGGVLVVMGVLQTFGIGF